jgi:hypothetical protein
MAGEPVCSESTGQTEAKEKLEIKTDVPNHLKGATITIRLADGRESTVPAEKFKVVPRKQQFIVTKVETSKVVSCTTNDPKKNRASLVAGYGAKNGLTTSTSGSTVTVETKSGAVGGAQYQRMLNEDISVGVQAQTNGTGSLLLGLDF